MARDWLKTLRAEKALSQTQVATAAGITPASKYSRIELGYVDLNDVIAASLAKAFGVSSQYIHTGSSEEARNFPLVAPTALANDLPIDKVLPAPPAAKGLSAAKVAELNRGDSNSPALRAGTYDGGNILDPIRFDIPPPRDELCRGNRDLLTHRAHLKALVVKAAKVLHTSKIRPAIWVAWRDFERDAQRILRESTEPAQSSFVQFSAALPSAKSIEAPKIPTRCSDAKIERRRGHKNLAGLLFDAAREHLPAALFEEIKRAAGEAKKADPSMGFMRRFAQITRERLSSDEYGALESRVLSESARFNSSR